MDLAGGHTVALESLDRDELFSPHNQGKSSFGGSGGKFRAYNLGKGKGMSVLQMVDAMKKVTGYGYPYEVVGRRYALFGTSVCRCSSSIAADSVMCLT